MKTHLVNTKENRQKQCEKEIQLIMSELDNPENFEKNRYAEEALNDITIKEDNSNGNRFPYE